MTRLHYFVASLLVSLISCAPLPQKNDFVTEYLTKFGYLSDSTPSDLEAAISNFQRDVGLNPTGIVSPSTLDLMKSPRCGTPTVAKSRRKRFVPHDFKWPRTALTWKLTDPYNKLSLSDVFVMRNVLHRSFSTWSQATKDSLKFVEVKDVTDPTDINVYFAHGKHNDSLPFDGSNGVVAHGFYPSNGNLHFDADEIWTVDKPGGINVYQTALHEIGHLLGLEHSQDWKAVMFPINRPFDPNFSLSDDDVRGIRYLYSPWTWRYYLNRYYKQNFSERKS